MTIREFIEMFVDPDTQEFRVWSNSKEKNIFRGFLEDCPDEIAEEIITSIDNIDTETMIETKIMTVNVE